MLIEFGWLAAMLVAWSHEFQRVRPLKNGKQDEQEQPNVSTVHRVSWDEIARHLTFCEKCLIQFYFQLNWFFTRCERILSEAVRTLPVSVLQYCLTHLTVATVLIEHIVLWRAVSDKVINISHNKKQFNCFISSMLYLLHHWTCKISSCECTLQSAFLVAV